MHADAGSGSVLLHVLLALAAVIAGGRLLGWLLSRFGQPPVIGEVAAGILLGPSFLGRVAPAAADYWLPQEVAPYLGIIAQVGIILYLFLVGLETDLGLLRRHARATLTIATASMLVPFALGAGLALALYPRFAGGSASLLRFSLFLGTALAITAFPVLARILSDRGKARTELGTIALACAAVNDAFAWCLLAVVVGVSQASLAAGLLVAALTVALASFMFLVVRPLALWVLKYFPGEEPPAGLVAAVFVALLLSAAATEFIGIHALFGAFLLGVALPHDHGLAKTLSHKLGDLLTVLLLPAFFALTGLRTDLGRVAGLSDWLICAGILLVATSAKVGGTLVAARRTGLSWRSATALGILLNTRGLMELVVLTIGLDLGILSPALFAMMVVMALVTTLATTPLLRLVAPSWGTIAASEPAAEVPGQGLVISHNGR